MTKHIEIRGAKPIGDQKIDEVSIHISGFFPDGNKTELDELGRGFENDAYKIFQGLRSLPGGTFDQLLILMLQKTATSFIVSHDFHDAPLRAAAPDLLKACEKAEASIIALRPLADDFPDATVALNAIRKAIAKARGEGEAQDG